MNKFLFLVFCFSISSSSFAQEVYVVSNSTYCVLTETGNPHQKYLNNLNQVKKWSSYQKGQLVANNITLNKFGFNLDVCPDTILLNEKDEEKYQDIDIFSNKKISNNQHKISKVTDIKTLSDTKKIVANYIYKNTHVLPEHISAFYVFSGFIYQNKNYQLVEASSSTDHEVPVTKKDFSVVLLVNLDTKEIIPVETWFASQDKDNMRIVNKIDGFLDIDNDSEYELIVRSSYYEGSSSILYKIINNKAVQKRSCGCGV